MAEADSVINEVSSDEINQQIQPAEQQLICLGNTEVLVTV